MPAYDHLNPDGTHKGSAARAEHHPGCHVEALETAGLVNVHVAFDPESPHEPATLTEPEVRGLILKLSGALSKIGGG